MKPTCQDHFDSVIWTEDVKRTTKQMLTFATCAGINCHECLFASRTVRCVLTTPAFQEIEVRWVSEKVKVCLVYIPEDILMEILL